MDCLIGRGGMGEVYLARHRHLDRQVALKLLPSELADDQVAMRAGAGALWIANRATGSLTRIRLI